MILEKSQSMENKHAMDWISTTTNAQSRKEREKDQEMATKQKKLKTLSFFKSNSSFIAKITDDVYTKMNTGIKQRKSSSLSELSPELITSVNANLTKINS